MKRFLLSAALLLACSGVALAQESEFSGGGGGGITAAPGSGTAGRVPQFASTTSLEDSKMLTSGTNSGTWTLYDDTAVTGNSSLAVRSGAGQSSALFAAFANNGTTVLAEVTVGGSVRGVEFRDNSERYFYAGQYGIVGASDVSLKFSSTLGVLGPYDIGLARSAAGILAVTDGSTGQGGIGIADSATNTVSDALILRHQGGTVAGNGFGTGLVWQGENDGGVMHPMASIDAVYVTDDDTNEQTQFVFKNYHLGAEGTILTLDQQFGETYLGAPGSLGIRATNSITIDSLGGDAIYLRQSYAAKWQMLAAASGSHWAPTTTNTYDIGTSTLAVKDIYAAGLAVSDAATNTVTDAIALRHATSGTATTGFGTGLLFQGEDAAGNMQDMASIDAVYTDATNGSEDAKVTFYSQDAGTLSAGWSASVESSSAYLRAPGSAQIVVASDFNVVATGGHLQLIGNTNVNLVTSGVVRWTNVTAGHFAPYADNTYDIGTSSASVREVFANSLTSPNYLNLDSSGGQIRFATSNTDRWVVVADSFSPLATNAYNFGDPTLLVKDSYLGTSIQGTRTQAISDNAAAATFVTIAVPTSNTTVGGRIFYTITAIDAGTAIQTKTGTYSFGLNNIGGTVTGAGTDVLEHSQLSVGTLAPTFSVNISGTNAQFQLVLDTSLDAGAETLKIEYRVQIDSGTATVTPAT